MSAPALPRLGAAGPPVRHVLTGATPDRWATAAHVQRGWHATFAVLLALVVVATWPDGSAAERALLVAGTGVLLLGHVRWGLRALGNGVGGGRYAAAAVLGVGLVALAGDAVVLLLVAVVPQLYWVLPLREALRSVGAVFALVGLGLLLHGTRSPAQLAEAVLVAVGGFGLSALAAAWLAQVLAQSEARARLIDELEATRAQLAGAHHETGVLEERTRLAGEIHDSLAQGFASIQMLLLSVERDLDAGRGGRAAERVRLAREQAGLHLEESRSIVAVLGPVDLRRGDLLDNLRAVVERVGRELDVQAAFTVDGPVVPVARELQVVLLRVLQEALANVRKHARACEVRVAVRFGPGDLAMTVQDDGAGFAVDEHSTGFGLPGLRRRADDAGGSLTVTSVPGVGTTVGLLLPLGGPGA